MNLRDFVLNSDYPPDKCCWYFSYRATIPSSGRNTTTITANGIDYEVVALGCYSTDNGATWKGMPGPQGNPDDPPVVLWLLYDQDNHPEVNIDFYSGRGIPSGTTVLYRIAFILKEHQAGIVPKPTSGPTNFRFNSDYGYLALIASGTWTPQASPSPQVLYQHNLGYKPLVLAWDGISDWGDMKHTNLVAGDSVYQSGLYVTDTQLCIYCPAASTSMFPPTGIHWRLYGEQNG